MKMIHMKYVITAAAGLMLFACSGETPHSYAGSADGKSHAGHQMDQGLVISAARVKPPFPGRDTAAGYFEITNHGPEDDALIAASSPVSPAVEIHNHIDEDGVMKMRQVERVDLPAGETVVFKPGGYHLMMFKTALEADQPDVSVTLTYEKAEAVTLIIPVKRRGDGQKPERHHKGHDRPEGAERPDHPRPNHGQGGHERPDHTRPDHTPSDQADY